MRKCVILFFSSNSLWNTLEGKKSETRNMTEIVCTKGYYWKCFITYRQNDLSVLSGSEDASDRRHHVSVPVCSWSAVGDQSEDNLTTINLQHPRSTGDSREAGTTRAFRCWRLCRNSRKRRQGRPERRERREGGSGYAQSFTKHPVTLTRYQLKMHESSAAQDQKIY